MATKKNTVSPRFKGLARLVRHGHSSAVIIPAQFLRKLGVKRGDFLKLKFDFSRAKIILIFTEARQLRLDVLSSRFRTRA